MSLTGLEQCTRRDSKFKFRVHLVGENSVNEWTNRWWPINPFNFNVTVGQL